MDLSALKTLNSANLSLTDYLGKSKTSYFDTIAQSLTGAAGLTGNAATDEAVGNAGVNITLSPEAQKLLAQGSTTDSGKATTTTGVQKTAQNFMMSFFDQSGIDMSKLSDSAADIIKGLQDVIAGSGATSRDLTTDSLEQKSDSDKKVYTITGDKTRLRMAIQYADGKPASLSITDIAGAAVETANFTIKTASDGSPALNVDRTQKAYQNGHMVTAGEIEPLSIKLYAA